MDCYSLEYKIACGIKNMLKKTMLSCLSLLYSQRLPGIKNLWENQINGEFQVTPQSSWEILQEQDFEVIQNQRQWPLAQR
ncbi:unnamed protein product [Paramecium octaurelia]|uniref:Uncharacterized protein n=1 Tax=Paramecium octaurelia TaxID=43137 RepID=A0A8S1XKD6_PAROT|nr:unnamed protein product [Paramecium octaurelia]